MINQSTQSDYVAVMGMGKTGVACTKFLIKQGISVKVMDNRENPPGLATLQQAFLSQAFSEPVKEHYLTGRFDAEQLAQAHEIVISPGLSLREPALTKALANGIPVISEIELFARYVNAPVIAITGSNGKSTVTTLVGEMAKQAGWRVQVGGNLGTPALDLLCTPAPDLYVLELSSFQLETTSSLNPTAAVVLNISADHMDRYDDLADYIAAKQRVFQGDGVMVLNADDPAVMAMLQPNRKCLSFSLYSQQATFSVGQQQGEPYFMRLDQALLPTKAAYLQSAIMRANILASLALGEAVGLPMPAMLETLKTFRGLAHRCVLVRNRQGVDWFNDSKGTNVGATIAAVQGLEKPGRIILIAGGEGKGADFTPLAEIAAKQLRACVLIGRDAPLIDTALNDCIPTKYATTMQDAVQQCAELAQTGDAVLLSPACASFDMFTGYDQRGRVFEDAVRQLSN